MSDNEWLGDYIMQFLKSPSWAVPIMQFIDENCIFFDNEDENKLEYTLLHTQFKQLVDGLLAAHLLEVGITVEQFSDFVDTANADLHHLLVEQLLSVEDFLTFKAMMVKRNMQQEMECLRALEGKTSEVKPDPPAVVGGAPDTAAGEDDWALYDEEERQLREALALSEQELHGETAEIAAAQRRQEEAEIKHAIAMSLQLQEEAAKQAQSPPRASPLAEPIAASPVSPAPMSPAPQVAAQTLPPPPNTLPPLSTSQQLPMTSLPTKVPLRPAAPLTASKGPGTGEVLRDVSSLVADTAPLVAAPETRARAAEVLSAAVPIAAPAAVGPSEEEMRRRAEHLRAQRQRLLEKKNAERQKVLEQTLAPATAVAAAAAKPNMVEELTLKQTESASTIPMDEKERKAQEMRMALTKQLKASLISSGHQTQLDGQLGRLDALQR